MEMGSTIRQMLEMQAGMQFSPQCSLTEGACAQTLVASQVAQQEYRLNDDGTVQIMAGVPDRLQIGRATYGQIDEPVCSGD